MLEKIIKKFDIKNIELFYEGNHNKTYKGFFCDEVVQVRIAKNKIVNHKNEILLLKNRKDIIYIDDEVMIKKWIDGDILNSNSIDILTNIKNELTKHWYIKNDKISIFDDSNHSQYINDIVLCHGDIRKKNIIIDNKGQVNFIDFEWINYNSKYFDLAHLYLYCDFSIKNIVLVFEIDIKKLEQYIVLVTKFNLNWEEKNLNK